MHHATARMPPTPRLAVLALAGLLAAANAPAAFAGAKTVIVLTPPTPVMTPPLAYIPPPPVMGYPPPVVAVTPFQPPPPQVTYFTPPRAVPVIIPGHGGQRR